MAVEKRVFKNLKLFMEDKKGDDDLFDRINTSILNQYLNQLMDGLTAKVNNKYIYIFLMEKRVKYFLLLFEVCILYQCVR